jgi:hypothetical protein
MSVARAIDGLSFDARDHVEFAAAVNEVLVYTSPVS